MQVVGQKKTTTNINGFLFQTINKTNKTRKKKTKQHNINSKLKKGKHKHIINNSMFLVLLCFSVFIGFQTCLFCLLVSKLGVYWFIGIENLFIGFLEQQKILFSLFIGSSVF